MKSQKELEALGSYLSDFIRTLPGSTQVAVSNHIQFCISKVIQEVEQQYVKQEPDVEKEKAPE